MTKWRKAVTGRVHEVEIERSDRGWWVDCSCGWFHAAKNQIDARWYKTRHLTDMEDSNGRVDAD